MRAATKNIDVEQNTTVSYALTIKDAQSAPIDLTGCTLSAAIRADLDAQSPLATFTCAIPEPLEGKCTMELPASESAKLKVSSGVWAVYITFEDGKVVRLIDGKVKVYRG